MSTSPKQPPPIRHGYGKALQAGFWHTTRHVQDMHHAIADKSFDALQSLPLLATPSRWIKKLHDTITDGSYAVVRHGGSTLLSAASELEQKVGPRQRIGGLESILNGVFGDFLRSSGNPLAAQMGFYVADQALPLVPESLSTTLGQASSKLCIFIHGLCMDEHCWEGAATKQGEVDFGQQLHSDLGYSALYLRYNTGLGLDDNGQQLAQLLNKLLENYPVPITELVLIGHSMGGLVARAACDYAQTNNMAWLAQTRMVICLGSPHAGSNLEKLGQLSTNALQRFAVTRPLGRLAAGRSAGIQQLRHGLQQTGRSRPPAPHLAYRFVGASLVKQLDHPLSRLFGDGLVTLDSATEPQLAGNVEASRFGGVSHLGLLKSPAVYQQICQWLQPVITA